MLQSIAVGTLVLMSLAGILVWVALQSKSGSKVGCSGNCSSCSDLTKKEELSDNRSS